MKLSGKINQIRSSYGDSFFNVSELLSEAVVVSGISEEIHLVEFKSVQDHTSRMIVSSGNIEELLSTINYTCTSGEYKLIGNIGDLK